jgi:GT2 family glycosyltransferase
MTKDLKISIIIITYNRANDMLELAKNISALQNLDLLHEVVIINNHSSESYQGVTDFIHSQPQIPFRFITAPENLGVARGRNFGISLSSAPILLFIDDDALFNDADTLQQVQNIFNEDPGREKGIAAFRIFYQSTMDFQENAFPHKNFEERKSLRQFDTYYFSGCSHAIRRDVFQKAGHYPENFFYGMEEYDLSYRALNAGFKIVYDDRVTIIHKESPSGRLTNKDKLRGMWVNKSKVAWKYLPKKYFYSTAILWSWQFLRKTGFNIGGWLKGWKQISAISKQEKRNILSQKTLDYLDKVKARLTY